MPQFKVNEEIKREIESAKKNIRRKFNTFVLKDDYYIGITTNGEFLFDIDDYEKVLAINKYWKINNSNYVLCYLSNKEFQLHRYLMGMGRYNRKEDIIVDHINGNKLDNRKSNLRITHRKNNPKNCSIYSNNTSGVKGLYWNKDRNKWQVSIQIDKKTIYLGLFVSKEMAIKIRQEAEAKYFKEFKREEEFL